MNICVWYFSLGNILFSNRHWYIYLYLGPFKVMDYWFLDSLIYLEHTDTVKVLMLCGKHLYSLSHLPSLLFFKKKKKSDTLFFFLRLVSNHRHPPASASLELGLEAWTITAQLQITLWSFINGTLFFVEYLVIGHRLDPNVFKSRKICIKKLQLSRKYRKLEK